MKRKGGEREKRLLKKQTARIQEKKKKRME